MSRRRKPQKQPPPEFVKELTEWLGRVLIATSQLEHGLAMLLGDLLKLNKLRYTALLIPMSTTTKLTLLRQLGAEYLNQSARKELRKALDEYKACAKLRNSLVHGFYGAKRGKFVLITFSGDGRFSGRPISWTPKDLQNLVKRISHASASVPHLRPLFPVRLSLPKNRLPIDSSGNE
jgi:hypothetical protein